MTAPVVAALLSQIETALRPLANALQAETLDPFISPKPGVLCENSVHCLHEFTARQP